MIAAVAVATEASGTLGRGGSHAALRADLAAAQATSAALEHVSLGLGEPVLMRQSDGVGATVDAELRQHALDVRADRLWTDDELGSDLNLAQTAGKQLPESLARAR